MSNHHIKAYQDTQRKTSTARENEARVLTEGARKLQACQENWDAEDRQALLDAALRFNQKIWTIFQSELGRPDNPLPKDLRLNLLRLSAFIDKQIFKTMSAPSPEKLTPIININLGIADGLRGKPGPGPESLEEKR